MPASLGHYRSRGSPSSILRSELPGSLRHNRTSPSEIILEELPATLRKHRSRSSPGQKTPSNKELAKYYKSNWYSEVGEENIASVDEGIVSFANGYGTTDLQEIHKTKTLPRKTEAKKYIKNLSAHNGSDLPVFKSSLDGTLVPVEHPGELKRGQIRDYYVFSELPNEITHESVIQFMNRERAVARKRFVDDYKKQNCQSEGLGCVLFGGKTKRRGLTKKQPKPNGTRRSRK